MAIEYGPSGDVRTVSCGLCGTDLDGGRLYHHLATDCPSGGSL